MVQKDQRGEANSDDELEDELEDFPLPAKQSRLVLFHKSKNKQDEKRAEIEEQIATCIKTTSRRETMSKQ